MACGVIAGTSDAIWSEGMVNAGERAYNGGIGTEPLVRNQRLQKLKAI